MITPYTPTSTNADCQCPRCVDERKCQETEAGIRACIGAEYQPQPLFDDKGKCTIPTPETVNSALHLFKPGDRAWFMRDNRAQCWEVVLVTIYIAGKETRIEVTVDKDGETPFRQPENQCFRTKEMLLATL